MNVIKPKQTYRYREQTSGYRTGKSWGEGKIEEGIKRYKLLGIK